MHCGIMFAAGAKVTITLKELKNCDTNYVVMNSRERNNWFTKQVVMKFL